jgi:hemoglobin
MPDTLFERLGGREGIAEVVRQSLANHFSNPAIKTRFEHALQSEDDLRRHATEFFCTGLSGVETYEGRAMPEAHAGMNITDAEFNAVLDDILAALESKGVGELEQAEVLKILYGMKPDVVGH